MPFLWKLFEKPSLLSGMPKLLLIRFSSMGDVAMVTALLPAIKTQMPNAEVHFVVKNAFAGVVANNPYVAKLHIVSESLQETIADLQAHRFDAIIDLQRNHRSARIINALGGKAYRIDKLNIRKWFAVNLKLNVLPKKHFIDRVFETAQPLGIVPQHTGMAFKPSPDAVFSNQLATYERYVAIAIGAAHATKQIPVDLLVAIIEDLPCRTLLLGGPGDVERAHAILQQARRKDIINLVGSASLNQSGLALQGAQTVLAPDTGLMHLSAALGKPVVVLWASTVPELGVWPFYGANQISPSVSLGEALPCRPCTKMGRAVCPLGHYACMTGFGQKEVLDALLKVTPAISA